MTLPSATTVIVASAHCLSDSTSQVDGCTHDARVGSKGVEAPGGLPHASACRAEAEPRHSCSCQGDMEEVIKCGDLTKLKELMVELQAGFVIYPFSVWSDVAPRRFFGLSLAVSFLPRVIRFLSTWGRRWDDDGGGPARV